MKRIARIVAGTACLASMVLAGAQEPDGGICVPWTLGWMALCLVSGFVLSWLREDGERKQG